jgi:hypothetical protein
MGLLIEDGKGRGYISSVSESNRLNVSAKSNPRAYYISRDDGLAFTLNSVDADADAGDIICYLKNTSATRNMYIGQIHFAGANAVLWKTWVVSGVAGGTSITASNLNLTSGKSAEATAFGNNPVTGLALDVLLDTIRSSVGSHGDEHWEDVLVLGPNNAIAIEYDTGTTGPAEVSIEFHYEDITRSN